MTGTERKVFQKYYPPDFDATKLPRMKQPKNRQWVQRVMTPFNMRCNTCNEYIYKGKKFNMRREPAEEFYLGMRIWRFYFRCPNCLADISFKTDLENCDYQAENGATRLFEAFKLWKDSEKAKEDKEEEDKNDPMKQLEKRTKMSRAEMEAMGKLEEMQEMNRKHEGASKMIDNYLEATDQRLSMAEQLKKQEELDEALIKQLYGFNEEGKVERRIKEEDDEDEDVKPGQSLLLGRGGDNKDAIKKGPPRLEMNEGAKKRLNEQRSFLSKIVIAKKTKVEVKEEEPEEGDDGGGEMSSSSASKMTSSSSASKMTSHAVPSAPSGLAGLAAYGSSSDSE